MDHLVLLSELKSLGTEQNQKIYKRHGVKGELYGVSFANLEKLKKKIKCDHQLAQELWDSKNHDGQILATMIADSLKATDSLLEKWLSDVDNNPLADAFSVYVSKTSFIKEKMEKWIKSENEWISRVGWALLALLANSDQKLGDKFFETYLKIIERDIHTQKNFTKGMMNRALIAIGLVNKTLEEKALAIAAKIGKVDVDHGETSCKTPDAIEYIKKTVAYREQKASKTKVSKAK